MKKLKDGWNFLKYKNESRKRETFVFVILFY